MKDSLESVFTSLLHGYSLCACLIFIENGEGPLQVGFYCGSSGEFSRSLSARSGEGILGITHASGISRRVENILEDEKDPLLQEMRRRQQARSALLVPLAVEGRVLGAVA